MVPVICIWIGIKLASVPRGMLEKIPCAHKTKELKNMSALPGNVHLSRMVSERALVIPMTAIPAVGDEGNVFHSIWPSLLTPEMQT